MIIRSNSYNRAVPRVLLAGAVLFAITTVPGWAQAPDPHAHGQAASQNPPSGDQSLADQVQQLREQINQLQDTIRQQGRAQHATSKTSATAPPTQGMAGGAAMSQGTGEMSGMPMMEMGKMMQEMGKPMQEMGMKMQESGMNMQQMGMNMEKMGMREMGGMGQMGGMTGGSSTGSGTAAMGNMSNSAPAARQTTARSALPGFPGASHLYHIGSTGFFLDHPEHISLSAEQKTRLSQMKEKATLDNTGAQRKIDEAEQKLWTLTASDQPDQAAIAAQVKTIEGLRADQRLAYIRAVGEAAQVLTDQQRQTLLGKVPMSASK